MPASPVRKLVPFALKAKQRGIKVYHLNIGQPDIETPQSALDAVKNNDLKIFEYAEGKTRDAFAETVPSKNNTKEEKIDTNSVMKINPASEKCKSIYNIDYDPLVCER